MFGIILTTATFVSSLCMQVTEAQVQEFFSGMKKQGYICTSYKDIGGSCIKGKDQRVLMIFKSKAACDEALDQIRD